MDVLNLTKITIAWELFESGLPKSHIAENLSVNRETIHLWIKGIQGLGLLGFMDRYSRAKKGERTKRQVDAILKRRIWRIRDREMDCCGQKIKYFLNEEYGSSPAVSKIYEILAEKYKLKSKWKKNQKRGPVPKAEKVREVIQMDTIDFGEIFAFTRVDIFSKEADVLLAPELTSQYRYSFLKQCMKRRFNNFVELIQTDGGSEFKDEFKRHMLEYAIRHRVSHPYKKNEQSFIESFNRSFRKECLGWTMYKIKELRVLTKEVEQYVEYYHQTRPHISLGMWPPLKD